MSRPKWGRGYAMVPGWLLRKKPSPNALVVYVHLAMHGTFNTGEGTYESCKPSKKTLAAGDQKRGYPGCGLGEQVIGRALRELEALSAIKGEPEWDKVTGAQLPNVYRLIFGEIQEEDDANPNAADGDETPGQQGVSPVNPPADETSTEEPPGGITGDTPPRDQSDTPRGVSPVIHNQEPPTKNPVTQKENQTPPVSHAARTAAAPAAETETGGESTPPADNPEPTVLDRLVAELAAAGSWDPDVTRDVLTELARRGRDRVEITRVARAVAAGEHGPTGSPRRLLTWWPTTAPADTTAAPAERYRHEHLPRNVPRCKVHVDQPADACRLEGHPDPNVTAETAAAARAAARAILPPGKPLSPVSAAVARERARAAATAAENTTPAAQDDASQPDAGQWGIGAPPAQRKAESAAHAA